MKTNLFKVVFFALVIGLFLAACGSGDENGNSGGNSNGSGASETSSSSNGDSLVIRYGSADADDIAIVQGVFAFKEHVESASNGSITVETYTNGVLGGDRELSEGLQIGTVDMTVILGGILGNYDPVLNIFSLPYLFQSKEASYRAVDGEFGELLAERIEDINFKFMGWADGGTYHVANSVKPVTSLEEMSGIKIRVPEIQANIDFVNGIGATPTPISFAETYTSLEQGVVDGLELPVELMYATKLMEPVEYLTLTGHSESIFPVLMNMNFWNGMTAEQQGIIMEGMEIQIETNRQLAQEVEVKYIEEFKNIGGEVDELSEDEKKKFYEVGDQIQEKYAPEVGQDLIDLAKSFN